MIDRAAVVLPQPLSPARPRLSPSPRLKSTPSTARTMPSCVSKCVLSPFTSRSAISPRSPRRGTASSLARPLRGNPARAITVARPASPTSNRRSSFVRSPEAPFTPPYPRPRASRVFRMALLPQELRQVVMAARRLARASGHLPAAERLDPDDGAGRGARGSVRVQDARLHLREEPPEVGRLSREDARREHVVHVVRDPHGGVETLDVDDREDRHEQLLPVDPMIARQAIDDRRCDEVAGTLARCAAREDLALRPLDLLDRLVVRRDRGLVDEGPEVHVPHGRVAHFDLLRLRDESLEERPLHGSVDEDARARGTLLTAEAERRAHHAQGGFLEVGARGDDRRVLAAHLRDDGLRSIPAERLERLHPDGARPREHEAVDLRIVDEFLPDRVAGSGEVVEDPGWETCLAQDLGEPQAHERRVARRLEDDRVARDD